MFNITIFLSDILLQAPHMIKGYKIDVKKALPKEESRKMKEQGGGGGGWGDNQYNSGGRDRGGFGGRQQGGFGGKQGGGFGGQGGGFGSFGGNT